MRRELLTLTTDETGTIALRTWQSGAMTGEYAFHLPAGFSAGDVRAALLATGWVEERGGELVLVNWLRCEAIGAFVEEMLSYFAGAEEPREELLRVRRAVMEEASPEVIAAIPLWAFAWLDLLVRDDLADAARSVHDVWSQPALSLDVDAIRRERLREMLARYPVPATNQLAPSARRRTIAKAPKFKRGG
jgi:hypothetical protein